VTTKIGLVAIGRNEGERLVRCLTSVIGRVERVVYVDSGSTDGSAARARELGAEVVDLDLRTPFTAARARNEGVARLLAIEPAIDRVQLVDGDCEIVPGWIEEASRTLDARPDVAVVCGRRRERYPEASLYNRVIDVEWDTPVGEAKACGGDAMMRVAAFREVGGFDASLIAGEEPELCLRLRARGWKILRIDHEMTLHDAAITELRQWWQRAVRSGHAYAEGADKHGRGPERHWVAETRRIVLWGALVPSLALGAAPLTGGLSLALLFGYPVSAYRAFRAVRRRGVPMDGAAAYAAFMTLAKGAEMQGALRYWRNKARGRRSGLIEYK
jgi:GT2 family glycosyltransferase